MIADNRIFRFGSFCLLTCCCSLVNGFEAYVNYPGSRAMGMAGVFSGQADDSSAIWYNPAGLIFQPSLKTDFTLEWSNMPLREMDGNSSSSTLGYAKNYNTYKYFAAYINQLPLVKASRENYGTGIAVFPPFNLAVYIDEASNPVDGTAFGIVDAVYYQLSGLVSKRFTNTFTSGGTLDVVWADISCRDYQYCVANGPMGVGVSLGLMYGLIDRDDYRLKLG